jgi:hypothetical protein
MSPASVTVNNRGRRSVTAGYYLHIVRNPKSPARSTDVGAKVKEADIPAESAARGGGATGSDTVNEELFACTTRGDIQMVMNTPYDPSFPKPIQDRARFHAIALLPAGRGLLGFWR